MSGSQTKLADHNFVVFLVIAILTDVAGHVIVHFIFCDFDQRVRITGVHNCGFVLLLGFLGFRALRWLCTDQSFLHFLLTKRSLVFFYTIVSLSHLDGCCSSFGDDLLLLYR